MKNLSFNPVGQILPPEAWQFIKAIQSRGHVIESVSIGSYGAHLRIRFKWHKQPFLKPLPFLVEGEGATLLEALEWLWISLGVETGKWEWK